MVPGVYGNSSEPAAAEDPYLVAKLEGYWCGRAPPPPSCERRGTGMLGSVRAISRLPNVAHSWCHNRRNWSLSDPRLEIINPWHWAIQCLNKSNGGLADFEHCRYRNASSADVRYRWRLEVHITSHTPCNVAAAASPGPSRVECPAAKSHTIAKVQNTGLTQNSQVDPAV